MRTKEAILEAIGNVDFDSPPGVFLPKLLVQFEELIDVTFAGAGPSVHELWAIHSFFRAVKPEIRKGTYSAIERTCDRFLDDLAEVSNREIGENRLLRIWYTRQKLLNEIRNLLVWCPAP